MQLLKLRSRREAAALTRLSDRAPFNDNGGEPDGNCYLIPLDECPAAVLANIADFGEIVEGYRVEYVPDDDNQYPQYGTHDAAWMGMQFDEFAYIVS